ncbi:hypothetical protein TNCT_606541 [Trichonephila clavata]|uniref:Uncharacterized protein n=1 Tax=Trichonephila clavata TaxID=2740835 RepID=A0A8X6J5I4_TRICU|nr:hypothetical protein TNCT_606541 [Trichonephila clavata]
MENKAEDLIKKEKMTEEVNPTKTEEEKLIQHITIVKNEVRFEDIQTFFQNKWTHCNLHQVKSNTKKFHRIYKLNLVREFGTQINPAEIHLQLAKTETSKETNIEYFYRMEEIASQINLEEEAENFYIIKGLKENRAIEMQLKSPKDIQELKERDENFGRTRK